MAELLVRVIGQQGSSIYQTCKLSQLGDVIVAMPDGWNWGNEELVLPFWRIFKAPAVDLATARTLTSPELPTDPTHPSATLQARGFKLDVDHASIPADMAAYIADDGRAAPHYVVPATFDLMSLKARKAPVPDPAVIGTSPAII